jgi:lipopolysaccharide transport protein LptA
MSAALLALIMLPFQFLSAAAIDQSNSAINLKAEGLEADLIKNELVLLEVRISQDGYAIQADEARTRGIDFKNSEWTFNGKVMITTPTGASSSDRAVVNFVQEAITELHISGQPATFLENDASKQLLAQGQANSIDYDLQKRIVRLNNNAWLKYQQIEYRGKTVVYDFGNRRIIADRKDQQGERLQITVTPVSGDNSTENKDRADSASP